MSTRVVFRANMDSAELVRAWDETGIEVPHWTAVKVAHRGSFRVSEVDYWLGIEPPACDGSAYLNLVAPDGPHDDPLAWGYTHEGGTWSRDPEGATGCFAHTDLALAQTE